MCTALAANMRKLSWTLLLPILLLFAQQGELRHEYSHYAEQATSCKATANAAPCLECLAYAQIAGAAKADVGQAILLTGLAFHFAPTFAVANVDSEAAFPRSRGPPTL